MSGYIKLNRTNEAAELLKDANAFMLLSAIALRAKRTEDFNVHDLQIGEALVGDYKNYGLSEQKYRTAKDKLEKWKLATFRPTNKGTIARLLNNRIYDINMNCDNEQINNQKTNQQRTDNEQITTNKNVKNDNNINKKNKYVDFVFLSDSEFWQLVKKIGLEKTQEMIEALNHYIGSSGTKYNSHYHTILNWVRRNEKQKGVKNENGFSRNSKKNIDFAAQRSSYGITIQA